ncbi:endonuclease [Tersicoccus sp. MR15.9]|uniref:endonuclease n=1 Tax=Tersicoccus mangrovi TaxID=3121635 RepID=UPI002FE60BF2
MTSHARTVDALLDACGTTFAEDAGITLKDAPAPLYQLLVLVTLLSTRIKADIAVAAARELFDAGWTTPERLRDSTWQQRVDALGRAHYRRYDEGRATRLAEGADLLLERWHGDLRRLRDEAGDAAGVQASLREFPGIGPTGAAIFCREAQGVWPVLAPFADRRVADGAAKLGLPTDEKALAALVSAEDLPALVAACVRVALDDGLAERVLSES